MPLKQKIDAMNDKTLLKHLFLYIFHKIFHKKVLKLKKGIRFELNTEMKCTR